LRRQVGFKDSLMAHASQHGTLANLGWKPWQVCCRSRPNRTGNPEAQMLQASWQACCQRVDKLKYSLSKDQPN
jgi:hypothetical protein